MFGSRELSETSSVLIRRFVYRIILFCGGQFSRDVVKLLVRGCVISRVIHSPKKKITREKILLIVSPQVYKFWGGGVIAKALSHKKKKKKNEMASLIRLRKTNNSFSICHIWNWITDFSSDSKPRIYSLLSYTPIHQEIM